MNRETGDGWAGAERAPKFKFHDVVRLRGQPSPDGSAQERVGIIDAVRLGDDRQWRYVVQVCLSGPWWSCADVQTELHGERGLHGTGESYTDGTHDELRSPPPVPPRFRLYERVLVVTSESKRAHMSGRVGVVHQYPDYVPPAGWYYPVEVCPEGVDLYGPGCLGWNFCENELAPTGLFHWRFHLQKTRPPGCGMGEKVLVLPRRASLRHLGGREAVIDARRQESTGEWKYSVHLLPLEPGRPVDAWCDEDELAPTGEFPQEPYGPASPRAG